MSLSDREGGRERDSETDLDLPRFDPGRDREAMREYASTAASEAVELEVYRAPEYDDFDEAFESGYSEGYQSGYTEGFVAGLDASPGIGGSGPRFEWDPAGIADANGRGVLLTSIAAVLAAVGYYGFLGIRAGTTALGTALPTPVYLLAAAFLFVLGLVRHLRQGIAGLAFAAVFSATFAILLTFAVEGALVLVEAPGLALEGARGATVLAVALVVAFVGYWLVLSIVEWDARATARARAREYAADRARSRS